MWTTRNKEKLKGIYNPFLSSDEWGKEEGDKRQVPFCYVWNLLFSAAAALKLPDFPPQKRENCVPALLKIRFTAEQNKRLFLQALLHPFRETRMLWNSTEFQTRIQQKQLSVAPCKVVKCSAPPSSPNVSPSLFWRVTGLTAFLHLIAYLSLCNVPSYPQFHKKQRCNILHNLSHIRTKKTWAYKTNT